MRALFIGFFAFCATSNANADWQYTKWGMSIQQVLDASKGLARELSGKEKEGKSNRNFFITFAIAPYATGDFTFDVHFRSKPGRAVLDEVYLESLEPGRYQDILLSLTTKYGNSPNLSAVDNGAMGSSQTTTWTTKEESISLKRRTSIIGVGVSITYAPKLSGAGL